MASTLGGVDYSAIRHPEVERAESWAREAERTRAQFTEHGVHPATDARMAQEQPALHYLYFEILALTDVASRDAVFAKQASVVPPSIENVKKLSVLFCLSPGKRIRPSFQAPRWRWLLSCRMPESRACRWRDTRCIFSVRTPLIA